MPTVLAVCGRGTLAMGVVACAAGPAHDLRVGGGGFLFSVFGDALMGGG